MMRIRPCILAMALLAACAKEEAPRELSLAEAFPLPASGITPVDAVKITAGGREQWKDWLGVGDGDAFVMTAAASKVFSERQVRALMSCAANRFASAHGYAGWKAREMTVTTTPIAADPLIGNAMIEMHRAPLPFDVPQMGGKDWCADVPPQAL